MLLSPIKTVGQTNKLLLLEEFDPNVISLSSLLKLYLRDGKEKYDRLLQEIDTNLAVSSFNEFLNKFSPTIYQWDEMPEDDKANSKMIPRYSITKPSLGEGVKIREIRVSTSDYFQAVVKLYENKGKAGKINLDSDYSAIAELLNPEKIIKKARNTRDDLHAAYRKYRELEEANASNAEINDIIDTLDELRSELVDLSSDNNFIGVLALAAAEGQEIKNNLMLCMPSKKEEITETEQQLLERGKTINSLLAAPEEIAEIKKLTAPETEELTSAVVTLSDKVKTVPCRVEFRDNGEINCLPCTIVEGSDRLADPKQEKEKKLAEETMAIIAADFDDNAGTVYSNNNFVKKVVLQAFSGKRYLPAMTIEEAELFTDAFSDYYSQYQEGFINAVEKIVKKLLDVYVFFDHATIKGGRLGKLKNESKIIVSNCSANVLATDYKIYFQKYIEAIGSMYDENRICLSIIPGITDKDFKAKSSAVTERRTIQSLRYKKNKNDNNAGNNIDVPTLANLAELVEIMTKERIITFFNYTANKDTGFECFTKDTYDKYKKNINDNLVLNGNNHAVFVYPNFSVIPEEKAKYDFGNGMRAINGVGQYIDASYVAAGIIVATQDLDYIKEILPKSGLKIKSEYVNSNFDIEEYKGIIQTKLNCECKVRPTGFYEVDKDSFGFSFESIKAPNRKKTCVYKARTLCLEEGDTGRYTPLFNAMTKSFVYRYLKINANDSESIKEFKDDIKAGWENDSEDGYTNNILHKGESISVEKNGNDVKVNVNLRNGIEEITLTV